MDGEHLRCTYIINEYHEPDGEAPDEVEGLQARVLRWVARHSRLGSFAWRLRLGIGLERKKLLLHTVTAGTLFFFDVVFLARAR